MLDYMLMPLRKYVQFQGRSRRSEYWWWTLAYVIAIIVASGIDAVAFNATPAGGPLYLILVLATFLPSLAVGVRRLHDSNRSGWWLLISLIPLIGGLILLFFLVQDSTPGENRFGPSPKHDVASTFS